MKSSSDYRGNQKGFFIVGDISRREFLEAGIGLAVFASGIEMIVGCALAGTLTTGKSEQIVYAQLP